LGDEILLIGTKGLKIYDDTINQDVLIPACGKPIIAEEIPELRDR
jgi:hypothetical protein